MAVMQDTGKKQVWPYAVILLLVVVQFATGFLWLERVRYPFGSFHLSWSYGYEKTLVDEGLVPMLTRWAHEDYYPPLNVTLWAFVHYLIGAKRLSILITCALLYIPALFALGSLCRRATGGPWAGLCAVALTLFCPHIAFYFRVPSYEVSMAAMAVLMLWGVVASERFTKTGPLVVAAAAFAAGMLMKWTFVASAAGIAAFALIDAIVYGVRRKKLGTGPLFSAKQIFLAGLTFVLAVGLAAPWYFFALSWSTIGSRWPTDATSGGVFTQAVWYLVYLYKVIFSPVLTIAFLASTPLLFLGKNKRMTAALAAAFAGTYFVLSVTPHKEIRYGTVLVPFAAAIIGVGLSNAAQRIGKPIALKAAFAVGLLLIGATLWNTGTKSFAEGVMPLESGDLDRVPLDCLNDMDATMKSLEQNLQGFDDRKILRIAVHPLSPISVSFSSDVISYYLNVLSIAQRRRIELIGFGTIQYETFGDRYLEPDLLLVPQEIWKMTDADVAKSLKDMVDFNRPGSPAPPVPEYDPLFLERIGAAFDEIGLIKPKCVEPIHVFRRKAE